MWYVVEIAKVSPFYKDTVLWGLFPGHQHARRWIETQQAGPAGEDHRFTIRQLNRVEGR